MQTSKLAQRIALGLLVATALGWTGARAAGQDPDQDTTLVARCDGLPPSVSIPVMSWSETTNVCREMLRVLEGVRRQDVTNFEKAIYVLHAKGYEGDYTQIAEDLIEVIRLRGLYDKPDRWYETNNLIVKSWNAFHGIVGPRQIIAFLRAAGPKAARSLSDDGLVHMIVLMKLQYQQGDD